MYNGLCSFLFNLYVVSLICNRIGGLLGFLLVIAELRYAKSPNRIRSGLKLHLRGSNQSIPVGSLCPMPKARGACCTWASMTACASWPALQSSIPHRNATKPMACQPPRRVHAAGLSYSVNLYRALAVLARQAARLASSL